jgi:hypothetical protein
MDTKLIVAYQAVIDDLKQSAGWEAEPLATTLSTLAARLFELENWEKFLPLDEVPD